MLKRIYLFLLLLVMAVAYTNAGTWKMHNYYVSTKIENVYDTGDKIYYANGGRLFEFDKATTTTIALNRQNKLNGNQISRIYYDWENKLLFVAYLDNNIDIIDGDGNVSNVSNVKDAIMNVRNYTLTEGVLTDYSSDVINDITFAHGIAYVTVNYGYITIDETTKRILDNKDLSLKFNNTNINSVGVIGNTMLIFTNKNCYYGELGSENPFSEYARQSGSFTGVRFYPINETSAFVLSPSSGTSALYNYDFSGETPVLTKLVSYAPTSVQKTPTGFIANFAGQKFYYTIDPTGKVATKASSVTGFATADPMGDGTVWMNDANGLHVQGGDENYKMNSLTTDSPYWLKYNAAMDRLYIANSARNAKTNTNANPSNVINTYDGEQWENATAYTAAGSGYEFVFDPFDPYTYVRASWNSGDHKVTRNSLVMTYTKTNTPKGTYKAHPAFDNKGNLWIVSSYGSASRPVAVLPRSKYLKTSISIDDWFIPTGLLALNTTQMQASRFVISKLNNVKIYSDCNYINPQNGAGYIYAFDNDNVDPRVDTYRLAKITRFIDQNNKQIKWTNVLHLEEDNDGIIWVGYTGGLFTFDPNVVFDETPRAVRPYTSKFDEGKGYLCEGYGVYDVGVTRDNKKWLATNNGVYFVSADGSEVYNHFTTENSDIPSDMVYSIECDTIHDRVYIFTDNGFAEYIVNGDAAAVNFNDTYAFPNPVEPDFTGMVKIAKLMENSYVTITDRNGQVVAQMGPVMGSALWDCSGPDGERVPTGVYNIYAAQGGQPLTTGTPQATIMVIR